MTREELLILLIEECAEVAQAATKCLRFGYNIDHKIGYGNNRNVLATESGELVAVIEALKLNTGACKEHFNAGKQDKIERAKQAKRLYPCPNAQATRCGG